MYTGLQFRIKSSHSIERGPSFTYASLPGVTPTPLEWKTCCDPDIDIGGEHVTYHILTPLDDSLSTVMAEYTESNIVGLIIINTTNSTFLSNDFIKNAKNVTPPVYVISSRDGERLKEFVTSHDEGAVQIKVSVESAVDSLPVSVASTGPSHSATLS